MLLVDMSRCLERVLHFDMYVKRRVRSERRWKKAIVWGVQRISLFAFSESLLVLPVLGGLLTVKNAAGISNSV